MPTIRDENGDEIEVMSPEELSALEAKAAKADELAATLAEKEAALEKLTNKDFNFNKLRESNEKEREEMLKGFSEKEKVLIGEIDKMKARQDEAEAQYFEEAKMKALNQLAGSDKEMRVKIEEAVKESVAYLGKPKTQEEVIARYERAAAHVQGSQVGVNPLNRFSPATGDISERKGTRFTETPEGKALFEQKFAKEIAKAKKNNPNLNI